ncbi:MAG: hypothetical protein HY689_16305 [Chloroflexi bacterium]|nr:hypothetical protein [Chloroflexota bacterium]
MYRLPHPTERLEYVRVDFSDGSKRMWWQRNGRPGLQGLTTSALPPYGAEDLERTPAEALVPLVEGEGPRRPEAGGHPGGGHRHGRGWDA